MQQLWTGCRRASVQRGKNHGLTCCGEIGPGIVRASPLQRNGSLWLRRETPPTCSRNRNSWRPGLVRRRNCSQKAFKREAKNNPPEINNRWRNCKISPLKYWWLRSSGSGIVTSQTIRIDVLPRCDVWPTVVINSLSMRKCIMMENQCMSKALIIIRAIDLSWKGQKIKTFLLYWWTSVLTPLKTEVWRSIIRHKRDK